MSYVSSQVLKPCLCLFLVSNPRLCIFLSQNSLVQIVLSLLWFQSGFAGVKTIIFCQNFFFCVFGCQNRFCVCFVVKFCIFFHCDMAHQIEGLVQKKSFLSNFVCFLCAYLGHKFPIMWLRFAGQGAVCSLHRCILQRAWFSPIYLVCALALLGNHCQCIGTLAKKLCN